MISRWLSLCLGGMLVAVPAVAEACPQCAQNEQAGGFFWWVLASMILLPFPVAGAVVYIIKRGGEDAPHEATDE